MATTRRMEQAVRYLPGILALAAAFWLVFPFIRLDQADYNQANILVFRLVVGITIFVVMLGKMGFDIFFPQGMARKVSDLNRRCSLSLESLFWLSLSSSSFRLGRYF